MSSLIRWFITSIKREKGATAIEYALMVALISVAIIVTVGLLGEQLKAVFTRITEALTPPGILPPPPSP